MNRPPAPTAATPQPYRIRWGAMLRMVLLLALGMVLVTKVVRGDVLLYVNGIYARLIAAAGVALIVLGYIAGLDWLVRRGAQRRHLHAGADHHHASRVGEAAGYALMAVPLLVALLVPARPLGSAAVDARTVTGNTGSTAGKVRSAADLGKDTTRWTLLDWTTATFQTADTRTLNGKPVSLVGFVARGDGGMGDGYFSVARFVIVCCTADGNAVTLPVRWESPPPRDTWVQITGTIAVVAKDGKQIATVAATAVEQVPQPGQPYLYP